MKIDFTLFLRGVPRTGLIFAFGTTLALAIAPAASSTQLQAKLMAQAIYAPEGCRITRDRIGVYEEPNTTETARGILQKDVTVLLGLGSGEGWARITAPQTGWVQSKFLKGGESTACPSSLRPAPQPPSSRPATPNRPQLNLPRPPLPSQTVATSGQVTRAVCEVIPEQGLVVRDTPVIPSSRVIGQIKPGRHTFQFSDRRLETETPDGLRQWVYITAPAKGWIALGFAGGGGNLSGRNCR